MVTLKSPKPRYLWLSGFPFCLCDLGPLLGAVENRARSSKSRKCLPSAEGFVRCARPRGCAPAWNPGGGAPCTARLTSASGGGLPGPLAEGRGCRGRAPRHPAGRLRSLGRVRGSVSAPTGLRAHTNPLTRPSLEKRARGPRRGGGALSVDGGQGSRSDRAAAGLDAQERPQRSGLVAGVLFPQPPATWRRPPREAAGGPLAFDFCF